MSTRRRSLRSNKGTPLSTSGNIERRRWIALGVAGVIVLLLLMGLSALGRDLVQPSSAATEPATANRIVAAVPLPNYTPLPAAEPVNPLRGGHEMGEQSVPPAPRARPTDRPSAAVNLPERRYAFGAIPATSSVSHRFIVQNTGTADLLISKLFTSCGCTTASLSTSVIPAGKQAELTVVFDPGFHEVHGDVTRLVWLTTNDPVQPWVEIEVAANVQP